MCRNTYPRTPTKSNVQKSRGIPMENRGIVAQGVSLVFVPVSGYIFASWLQLSALAKAMIPWNFRKEKARLVKIRINFPMMCKTKGTLKSTWERNQETPYHHGGFAPRLEGKNVITWCYEIAKSKVLSLGTIKWQSREQTLTYLNVYLSMHIELCPWDFSLQCREYADRCGGLGTF